MTEQMINPNDETRVADGSKVELHFSVAIESGVEIITHVAVKNL